MRPKSPVLSQKKTPSTPARGQAMHQIRIIGGRWRRIPIKVLDKPGLRPTPDRVRETLFNWLGQDLTGWRCVDAFAGTGALGLEAASRGALKVVALEQEVQLAERLRQQVTRLQANMVEVQCCDAVLAMQRLPAEGFDLVFLDPPFEGPWFEPALRAAVRLVPVQGWVYLEAPVAWADEVLATMGLSMQRHLKAGAVHAHLLQRTA